MDLLKSIVHPEEVYALLKYKIGKTPADDQHANTVYIQQRVFLYHTKWQKAVMAPVRVRARFSYEINKLCIHDFEIAHIDN